MQAEIGRAQRSMASTASPGPLGFNNTNYAHSQTGGLQPFSTKPRKNSPDAFRRFVGNTRLRHQVLSGPARAATKDQCFLFIYFFPFFLAAFFRRRIEGNLCLGRSGEAAAI